MPPRRPLIRLTLDPRLLAACSVVVLALGCGVAATASGALPNGEAVARQVSAVPSRPAVPPAGAAAPPSVAPLRALREPDLLVTAGRPLSAAALARLRALPGVSALHVAAVGTIVLGGHRVRLLSGDPGALRAWMPAATARSDALWARMAAGDLAADYTLAKETRLPLGGTLSASPVGGPRTMVRLGAIASMQLPAIDAVAAPALGHALHVRAGTAVLVSAAGRDVLDLRDAAVAALGGIADVAVVHDPSTVRPSGEFLTQGQLHTLLKAALSRVGAPYVWGATGPASFDCSGLVGYAYAAAGVRMPRTSEQQWLAGVHIPPAAALPGDLLFWANDPSNPADVDHVAIYLGSGLMVSAPHTGDVVHVAPVSPAGFVGVVRVDPATAARVGGPWWAPNAPVQAARP